LWWTRSNSEHTVGHCERAGAASKENDLPPKGGEGRGQRGEASVHEPRGGTGGVVWGVCKARGGDRPRAAEIE
jgi:hypothetical protein